MDILNLLSGAPVMGNVAQLTSNQSAASDGAAFQKQLFGIVGAQQPAASDSSQAAVNPAILLANSSLLLGSKQPTEEELDGMIEQMLDQLDQLEQAGEVELTVEQQALIESLLQQIAALVEIISFSNNQSKVMAPAVSLNEQLAAHSGYSSNEALVKLSDQLLVLQQALQNGTGKVLFGKSAEQVVAEQLQVIQAKIGELTKEIKVKPTENAAQALPTTEASKDAKLPVNAAAHLQRLSQEAAYTAAANKAAEASSTTPAANQVNQPALEQTMLQTVLPDFQLKADNVKDFLSHLTRSAAGGSSAFVIADEFAETMRSLVVQRFQVTALNGVTEARLSLTPEHLGHVDVKISMQNGVLTAMFQTETAMAKDALENQMIQLRASLAAQGITVEKIEVAHNEFASQLSQQQKQGSHGNQQSEAHANSRSKEESFEEELLVNVTNQELGFGRAVNATI